MLMLLGVLIVLGLATAALSLTISRSKLTRGLRKRLPPGLIADLLGCPYCQAHWIAGLFAWLLQWLPHAHPFHFWGWLISTFAIVAIATLFTGWMQVNSIWAEDEITMLREKLNAEQRD